jgi:hypothetical protein
MVSDYGGTLTALKSNGQHLAAEKTFEQFCRKTVLGLSAV